MRIVFLNPTAQPGGAEVALLNILASLKEAEPSWEFQLIASDDGALVERAKGLGVSTIVLPFPTSIARLGDASAGGPAGNEISQLELLSRMLRSSREIARYAWQLRKTLRQLAPDVIHTNGFKMHLLGAVAKPRGVPLIWHVHDYVRARPLMARLMKLVSSRCSIALANSNSVASDVRVACGDRLRVQTIYNGLDTTVFSPRGARVDLDSLSGLAPVNGSTVRVGMLATFARWKGHETFLRALSLVPRDLSLRGYIIGGALYQTEGSQHSLAELKTMARHMGLTDRIGFTGFVDEPAAVMRSLDIVVHASTEPEPFGLVIAEGMACGCAVIASDAGGAAELFDANVNALSHRPGDVIALAQRIEELATKPELRARLGAAGRATAEQRFDRSRLATELAPIYRDVVAQRGKGSGQRAERQGQSARLTSDICSRDRVGGRHT
jgi:glycosyltransferase involved in cell wall biosynthesis